MMQESRPAHSLLKKLFDNTANFATTGGAADAYTATFSPAHVLASDFVGYLRIHATNTGASTLNANGTGIKNLMKLQGASVVAMVAGDLLSGGIYQVIRDQTGDRYLVISRVGQAAKGELPAQVAYEDEANVFTASPQKIKVSPDTISLVLTRAGAEDFQIRTNDNGLGAQEDATKVSWAYALNDGDEFAIYRRPAGGAYALIWEMNNVGKVTAGTVPLARIEGYTGSTTHDFGSIPAQSSAGHSFTVTGAALGDFVLLGFSVSPGTSLLYQAFVSAADTVTIVVYNITTGALDPPSRTYYVKVIKKDF